MIMVILRWACLLQQAGLVKFCIPHRLVVKIFLHAQVLMRRSRLKQGQRSLERLCRILKARPSHLWRFEGAPPMYARTFLHRLLRPPEAWLLYVLP